MKPFLRWLLHSDRHPFETVVMVTSALFGASIWFLPDSAPSLGEGFFRILWSIVIVIGAIFNIAGWILTYRKLFLDGAVVEEVGMGMVGFCLTVYGIALFAANPFDAAIVTGTLCIGLGIGCYFRLWQTRGRASYMRRKVDDGGS